MGDIDAFFDRKKKKGNKKKKGTFVPATELFKEEGEEGEFQNVENKNSDEKEDEWLEQTGEQEFVIESVGGIKRLELEERVSTFDNFCVSTKCVFVQLFFAELNFFVFSRRPTQR
jgi:hypothetical protein